MTLSDIVLNSINELKNKFITPRDLEDDDGEIIPKGTRVKVSKITKHGNIRDFTVVSPDGLKAVISMPLKDAKKFGITK